MCGISEPQAESGSINASPGVKRSGVSSSETAERTRTEEGAVILTDPDMRRLLM